MAARCCHRGEEVRVGEYKVLAGGTMYFEEGDLSEADLLVPLTSKVTPVEFGVRYDVLSGVLPDFGGLHKDWRQFLDEVVRELKDGKKILAFCAGSHGRTGAFLASLIAILEDPEETPDPIQAVRDRHCMHAVETEAQAKGVFALRGEELPDCYNGTFHS